MIVDTATFVSAVYSWHARTRIGSTHRAPKPRSARIWFPISPPGPTGARQPVRQAVAPEARQAAAQVPPLNSPGPGPETRPGPDSAHPSRQRRRGPIMIPARGLRALESSRRMESLSCRWPRAASSIHPERGRDARVHAHPEGGRGARRPERHPLSSRVPLSPRIAAADCQQQLQASGAPSGRAERRIVIKMGRSNLKRLSIRPHCF